MGLARFLNDDGVYHREKEVTSLPTFLFCFYAYVELKAHIHVFATKFKFVTNTITN